MLEQLLRRWALFWVHLEAGLAEGPELVPRDSGVCLKARDGPLGLARQGEYTGYLLGTRVGYRLLGVVHRVLHRVLGHATCMTICMTQRPGINPPTTETRRVGLNKVWKKCSLTGN